MWPTLCSIDFHSYRLPRLLSTLLNILKHIKCWDVAVNNILQNNVMLKLEQECGGLWAVGDTWHQWVWSRRKHLYIPCSPPCSWRTISVVFLRYIFWYSLGLQCSTIEICCFPGWGIFKPLTACSWRSWSHAVPGSSTFYPERLAWSWWSQPLQR